MNLPEPQSLSYTSLIPEIEKGSIKIPQFQRDFVWTKEKSANLIDSILKGYPIGTFIFWKTKERLRSIRNIGGIKLPDPEEGDYVNYVLDGQQRLTSLFASIRGTKVKRSSGVFDDFSAIFIDLNASEDEQIVLVDVENKDLKTYISINDLLFGELSLLVSYPTQYHKLLDEYKKRLQGYLFSVVFLKEASLDVATEVFTRINVGGKQLTLFEIMVAKTYDHQKNFDLAEKYSELVDRLRIINYETISDMVVLQTMAIILQKNCTKKEILKLNKNDFISIWNEGTEAIERATEYFRNHYRIPVSQLLPYNALVVLFAYFFYCHPDIPTGNMQKYLQDFFWRCALSGRYSSSQEAKIGQDVKRIDDILQEKLPTYDWTIDISTDAIKANGWFSAGRSYIKAILCIYAYQQPKSFNDNGVVNISNYWLKQANSKNYHHFFPKAYLSKKGVESFYINHIANITIVDDFLNKREIKAKSPSVYMKRFAQDNPEIVATMKTHLINDLQSFGVWDDDYDVFFDKRVSAIREEINKRIIPQENDKNVDVSIPSSEEDAS